MGALREENTTCNSKTHLHKSKCVYSDAQFIPPEPINRSDAETAGDGRGEV